MVEINPIISEETTKDYSLFLKNRQVPYQEDEQYLYVGKVNDRQGWALHLPIMLHSINRLLSIVLPFLLQERIGIRLAKSKKSASDILNGYTGPGRMCKIISIYPDNDARALLMAKELIRLTDKMSAPGIPVASRLGAIVYANFESFGTLTASEVGANTFQVPADQPWPFGEIVQPVIRQPIALYHNKYKPVQLLKSDVKGSVYKVTYFKGFLRLGFCILKEARYNMSSDEHGRTIQDRLQWQYTLYQELENQIRVPKVIDRFEMNDNLYLALQLIDGVPLDTYITGVYAGIHSWPALPLHVRGKLLALLQEIVSMVEKMHNRGLVHRDLTPPNVMVDKLGHSWLIDIELAYSLTENLPSPPFNSITPGYASPEQYRNDIPTVKEDIYGLAGLMIYFFCGFSPLKIYTGNPEHLVSTLRFLTGDEEISRLITGCQAENPAERPSISDVQETLRRVENKLSTDVLKGPFKTSPKEITEVIDTYLSALSSPRFISTEKLWYTVPPNLTPYIANLNRGSSAPLFNGVAGVLYVLGKAHRLGYSTDSLQEASERNRAFLERAIEGNQQQFGLLDGATGLALGLKEGYTSGLFSGTTADRLSTSISRCFTTLPNTLSLANGLPGAGLAIHQCASFLGEENAAELTQHCLDPILQQQHKDGYWLTAPELIKTKEIILGLGFGTAGVLYYLIDWLQHYGPDEKVSSATLRGLNWINRQADRRKGHPVWTATTRVKTISPFSVYSGTPGLALCFLKAHAYFEDQHFLQLALEALQTIPPIPNLIDYTQLNGLAGLGEVYLEAQKYAPDNCWQERADWIAQLFCNTFLKSSDCQGYWSMNAHNSHSAMLMEGCTGVAHFLLRYQHPEEVNFCLLQS